MYQKIVVPLDGSKLAECVLPYVEQLASDCRTQEVALVTVTEYIVGVTDIMVTHPGASDTREAFTEHGGKVTLGIGKMQKQGEKYLDRVAKRLREKGLNVRTEVRRGKPAEEIVSFCADNGSDLIIMASHGRSGPSRWALGSVADKVFRATCVPVMMIRAPGCMPGF